jgi:hypothetical protein
VLLKFKNDLPFYLNTGLNEGLNNNISIPLKNK